MPATLEELRAANEEAQAGNEELETAQEELESANEELNTLNEELKISNVEFSKVNRDLANLLESISIPLVMVGRDLRIRRFTRAIEPMLNLIASDVGRSITDLQPQMELPDLRRLLLDAMEGGNRKPRDIRDSHGRWYSLRILPSVGPDGKTDGAVLMLIDIDAAKRGLDFAEAIVETVREPLVILNQNLQVVKANKTFYETFQAAPEETEGRLIYDLGNGQWNIPKLRELLENILPAHSTFRDFEVTHEFEHVGRKVMLLNASEIFNPNAQARTILLAIEDATDRKQAEEALRDNQRRTAAFCLCAHARPAGTSAHGGELYRAPGAGVCGKAGRRSGPVHLLFRGGGPEDRGPAEGPACLLGGYRAGTGQLRLDRLRRGSRQGAVEPPGGHRGERRHRNLRSVADGGGRRGYADAAFPEPHFQFDQVPRRGNTAESMSRRRETRKGGCLRCGTTESVSIRKTPTGCSACSNACMEAKFPAPASVWRFVRRLSSARVDESGWNRKQGRALRSSSPFPPATRSSHRGAGTENGQL